jgi:hypothetical protein
MTHRQDFISSDNQAQTLHPQTWRRCETLQRSIILFTAANIVAVLVMGHVVFDEHLRSKDLVAAVLAVLAVVLVDWQ